MHGNSPDADRHLDAHNRADARFVSQFVCNLVGQIREGRPIEGERLALDLETLLSTIYSSPEPDLAESLKQRADMLLASAGGPTKLMVDRQTS